MIRFHQSGDFHKVNNWLEKLKGGLHLSKLDYYGKQGVEALQMATPVSSGKTADSWDYEIERRKDSVKITWINTNVVNGVNVAVLLQFGHATRSGTWVEGIDYIEPALRPIFEQIAEEAGREVRRLG
ncbi:MAG: HK97 gp10 family phage protein [Pseudobutyrivibrio sp.]|nr:HK97 gp10 family phage protein [Pseudobutyrivibrio sp.]